MVSKIQSGRVLDFDHYLARAQTPEAKRKVADAFLPMIAYVHGNWSFDRLFLILAAAATVILAVTALLPKQMPTAQG